METHVFASHLNNCSLQKYKNKKENQQKPDLKLSTPSGFY